MKNLLTFLWCLPQNLLGLLVMLFTKSKDPIEIYNGPLVIRWKYKSGVSLGQFIFVSENASENTIKHEYGHYKQSLLLGWLYLFVVGLPSIIWAGCFKEYRKKNGVSYYEFFTERSADKLGGVIRS